MSTASKPGKAYNIFKVLGATIVLVCLSSTIAFAAECNDNIDNDGDGKIDAYQDELGGGSRNFPTTSSIRNFMRSNGYPSFRDSFDSNSYTRTTFCNLAGYRRVTRYSSNRYSSCHNNVHNFFLQANAGTSRHFDIEERRACRQGRKVKSIACADRLAACENFKDDDGDGRIDFPADPGCERPSDDSEEAHDPECDGPNDDSEDDDQPRPQCDDGKDNDGDGKIDHPADPGCDSNDDDNEQDPVSRPQCDDGKDNDGDGKIDFPADPGCDSKNDNNEKDPNPKTECNDGKDNDHDGKIDHPEDPGCSSPKDDDESDNDPEGRPECEDEKDNDCDFLVDFPLDPGCTHNGDDDESNDNNRELARPDIVFPLGATSDRTPLIIWNPVDGATFYQVRANYINAQGQKTVDIFRNNNVRDTQYQVAQTLAYGSYRIYVRARGPQGADSVWSIVAKLEITPDPVALQKVHVRGPRKVIYNRQPIFFWTADSAYTSYNLMVKRSSDKSLVIQELGVNGTNFAMPFELAIGRYHFWIQGVTDKGEVGPIRDGRFQIVERPITECGDGIDNDDDGLTDTDDPGCKGEETHPGPEACWQPQCSDGEDNDGDGDIDYPADMQCISKSDNDEENGMRMGGGD